MDFGCGSFLCVGEDGPVFGVMQGLKRFVEVGKCEVVFSGIVDLEGHTGPTGAEWDEAGGS